MIAQVKFLKNNARGIVLSLFGVVMSSQMMAQVLYTEGFETDGNGTRYRANVFDDGASDVWTISDNSNNGPNGNTEHAYSNFVGNSWWVGEDIDAPDNPFSSPNNDGFLMLPTLDVSSHRGRLLEVKVYLAANTGTIRRYRADDFLQLKYAFDSDIATGAQSVNGLPTQANLLTGTYTIFAAFYGTGTTTSVSTALLSDENLDGDNDYPIDSGIPDTTGSLDRALKNNFVEWTFIVPVPIGDTSSLASIMFHAATTSGSEEIGIDEITISAIDIPTVTWDGSTGSDWDTADNWDTGEVPEPYENVVIPSGLTNYPTANSAVTVNSVTMNSGTSLIANDTFSGEVTFNREIDFVSGLLNGWYLMASPVVGEEYNDAYVTANDIASNGSNRAIASYLTSSDSWDYMQGGESSTFNTGQGYSIKKGTSTGDVSFTGTLNVDNAGVDVVLSADGNRFNLLGNPYTSYLASATFLNDETSISDTKTLWVWNQTLSTNGAYEVKTLGDAFTIAPGQGFFVQANAGGGTFNFDESNQAHNSTDTFQRNSSSRTEIKLNITDGSIHNFGKIYYEENATTGLDIGYEGELFSGTSNPFTIYTHLVENSEGNNYQIQSLPINDIEGMVVPIGVHASSGMEISVSAEALNLPIGIDVYLEDKDNNSFTKLNDIGAVYTTSLSSDLHGTGRFFLHTSSSALSTPSEILNRISIYTSSVNNLRITGLQEEDVTLKGYNILGEQILTTSFRGNGVNDIELPNLKAGIYIFQLETSLGQLNKKIILK